MLIGEKVVLRARQADDVPILHAELYDNVDQRSRTDEAGWRPRQLDKSPFQPGDLRDEMVPFTVLDRSDDQIAGACVLWGIDTHSRLAHIGLSLRPSFQGRGLGTDIVRVLCDYGFRTRGLHRIQIETLADNEAMIGSAEKVGFVREGVLREAGWVQGEFLDLVLLGLLAREWRSR